MKLNRLNIKDESRNLKTHAVNVKVFRICVLKNLYDLEFPAKGIAK